MSSFQVLTTAKELRSYLEEARSAGSSIGLVPTMGFLHEGHASLINASTDQRDVTIVSIYVNPLQFSPDEDFSDYPRDISSDLKLCDKHGTDVVFAPSEEEIKTFFPTTPIHLREVTKTFEGESRPTHFQGVATVVMALFEIVGESHAYFGEKDFQQLTVVKQLVEDHELPIKVIGCTTVREEDGLAKSSRNVYLSADERSQSSVLYQALKVGAEAVSNGETSTQIIESLIRETIETSPLAKIDYVGVVDSSSFEIPNKIVTEVRLLVACNFGQARLIDNLPAKKKVGSDH